MASERVERRLTAILAADVAGYSRLTGFDEEGTHARLQDHLRSLVDPKIAEHRGRVVKNTGDGMLAEFGSVVDAVRCAVDVQRGMLERNANVPQEKRIEFRIGINVGDIILDRGDIFGDGVNVAARLEAVAEPSGICVSGRVLEDIEGKLDIGFEDAGEQRLKNIARPVRVFRACLSGGPSARPPVLPLPDKPSIAVLPIGRRLRIEKPSSNTIMAPRCGLVLPDRSRRVRARTRCAASAPAVARVPRAATQPRRREA